VFRGTGHAVAEHAHADVVEQLQFGHALLLEPVIEAEVVLFRFQNFRKVTKHLHERYLATWVIRVNYSWVEKPSMLLMLSTLGPFDPGASPYFYYNA